MPRYKPPLSGKKGGGHKNVRLSKTLRCVSQRKLARKQNSGISTRKLALWPRKRCVSGGVSNSLRPCEMKDLFSTAHMSRPSFPGLDTRMWAGPRVQTPILFPSNGLVLAPHVTSRLSQII